MTNIQLIQNINPKIVKYANDDKFYLAINSFLGIDKTPAYTLFLSINDKIFNRTNDIVVFLYSLQNADLDRISSVLASGLDEYVYGEDYSISWSLYNYLSSYNNDSQIALISNRIDNKYIFPDLMDSQYNIINTDSYTTVADTNLRYYYTLNQFKGTSFTEEELKSFVKTFCNIILDNTTLDDFSDINNVIYKAVLKYYANGGTDDTVTMLNLILNNSSLIGTSQVSCCDSYNVSSTNTNSSNSSNTINLSEITSAQQTISCKDLYLNAMFMYLQKMLSDVHFYCDWFMIASEDDSYPNQVLVDKLNELFDEFIGLNFDLSLNSGTGGHDCKCDGKSHFNSTLNDNNYKILNNFQKILNYVETDTIEPNCNKIKVYGSEFATILPKLMFI